MSLLCKAVSQSAVLESQGKAFLKAPTELMIDP